MLVKAENAPLRGAASGRDRTVDLIKTAAIFGVLLIHVSAGGLSGAAIGSGTWIACLFWGSVSRAAVPLFLMASGALLLRPDRELTLRKLYTKNFPRLLAALLFWAVCYKVFNLLLWGALTPAGLVQAIKEVILFRHEEHLYYLHIMLLVYALLPITRLVAAHATVGQMRYLLGLWFLLGILYPTVKIYWPFTLLVGIPTQWLMNMTYAAIGYTLLGYFLSAHPTSRRWPWGAAALGGLCGDLRRDLARLLLRRSAERPLPGGYERGGVPAGSGAVRPLHCCSCGGPCGTGPVLCFPRFLLCVPGPYLFPESVCPFWPDCIGWARRGDGSSALGAAAGLRLRGVRGALPHPRGAALAGIKMKKHARTDFRSGVFWYVPVNSGNLDGDAVDGNAFFGADENVPGTIDQPGLHQVTPVR